MRSVIFSRMFSEGFTPLTNRVCIDPLIIGAGIATIGSLIGGAASSQAAAIEDKKAQERQYQYQTKLNQQQEQYALKNSAISNQYQRSLIHDSALLEKSGLVAAGLSPASMSSGSFGTVSGSDAKVDTPSAGAAGSFDSAGQAVGNAWSNFASTATQSLLTAAQVENVKEDTEGKEIDNRTKFDRNIADLEFKKAQAKTEEERQKYQQMINDNYAKFGERTELAKTIKSENDAKTSASLAAINDANSKNINIQIGQENRQREQNIKNAIRQYELMLKEGNLMDAQKSEIEQNILNLQGQLQLVRAQTVTEGYKQQDLLYGAVGKKLDNQGKVYDNSQKSLDLYLRQHGYRDEVAIMLASNAKELADIDFEDSDTKRYINYIFDKAEQGASVIEAAAEAREKGLKCKTYGQDSNADKKLVRSIKVEEYNRRKGRKTTQTRNIYE